MATLKRLRAFAREHGGVRCHIVNMNTLRVSQWYQTADRKLIRETEEIPATAQALRLWLGY